MKKLLKIAALLLCIVMMTSLLAACGKEEEPENDTLLLRQFEPLASETEIATVKTNRGSFKIALFAQDAPKAVENFISLAKSGYYNDTVFYKVVRDFMIQGGDPLGNGTGGESCWGTPFENEYSYNVWNFCGAVGMVNSGDNTNGSQFYIVLSDTVDAETITAMQDGGFPAEVVEKYIEVGGIPSLDGRYTVFGFIYEGMDVLTQIAETEVDSETGKPYSDVIVQNITFETYIPVEVIE